MSAPTKRPLSPIAGSIARAASPVPVEISSTLLPGPIAAAAITWGTKSRDQYPVKRSYAATSTALPAAACSPGANSGMASPKTIDCDNTVPYCRAVICGRPAPSSARRRCGAPNASPLADPGAWPLARLPHPGDRRRHRTRIAHRPPPCVHLRDERANDAIELVGIFDVDCVTAVRHH
jgi:hypothetical protein